MALLSVPLKGIIMYHADLQNENIQAEGFEIADGRTLTAGQQDINPGSTYTLPDLRNKFPIGADITKAAGNTGDFTVAGSGGAPGPKGNISTNSHALITAELPPHTHSGTVASSGTHSHTGSLAAAGSHVHAGSVSNVTGNHVHGYSDPGHFHYIDAFLHSYVQFVSVAAGEDVSPTNAQTNDFASTPNNGNIGIAKSVGVGITISANGDHQHTLSIAADGSHSHTLTVDVGGAHTHTFTTDATGSGTAFDNRPAFYGLIFIMKVRR